MKKFAPRTARLAGAGAASFALALAIPAAAWADPEVGPDSCSSQASGLGSHTFVVADSGCTSADADDNTVSVIDAYVDGGLATVDWNATSVTVAGLPNDLTGDVVVHATVTDPDGPEAEWTITVSLVAEEPDPTPGPDSFSVDAGDSVTGNVKANDGGAEGWSAELADGPTKGGVDLGADGQMTYTADEDAEGTDTFTYNLVKDGETFGPTTVTIEINAAGGGGDGPGDGDDDGDDGDDNDNGGGNDGDTGDGDTGGNGGDTGDDNADSNKDKLAETGSPAATVALTGVGVLGAGAAALWLARRRREDEETAPVQA